MSRAKAFAKINLRHRVFRPDDSGYHAVETLLVRTDLYDSVEVDETDADAAPDAPPPVEVDGPEATGVPADHENLCVVAARRFIESAFGRGTRRAVRIRLTKRIPAGSGLGGGSADAAATLRLLAGRWPRLDERELMRIAGRIGADVAFGLLGAPMALGWERGRRLLPLRAPPSRPALLVCPPFPIHTPDAYGALSASRRGAPGDAVALPGPSRLVEWDTLARLVRNDLEAPALRLHPGLARCLETVRAGPCIAGMTGSGSALFAIFDSDEARSSGRESLVAGGFGPDGAWRILDTRIPGGA